jgi:hypothetical protein
MSDASFQLSQVSPEGSVLAIYELPSGAREVVGYSLASGLELRDRASDGSGEVFIDRGYFWVDGLTSFVAEYVRHARRIGAVPSSPAGMASIVDPPEVDAEGIAVLGA